MVNKEAIEALQALVGKDYFCCDPQTIQMRTKNTLGLTRNIPAIIYPEKTDQVQAIVYLANRFKFSIYPYSTGKNIGYGERLPVTDDNVIMDLGRLNKIIYVDPVLGYADLQTGVTQGMLCDYLEKNNLPFFSDPTDAGRDASIVGNALEGGFGTTPKGNRRKEITCVKGVYGNGELFDTGYFPGNIGPDFAGIFVQSNFGIITQLRIHLNPSHETYQSFTINLKNETRLIPLINAIRELRQKGTLINQVILVNAVDGIAATTITIPEAYRNKKLTNDDARKILSNPFVDFGPIFAIGTVYGSKEEVSAKKKTIRKTLHKHMSEGAWNIRYMTDNFLKLLKFLFRTWPMNAFSFSENIIHGLVSFGEGHGLMGGKSSDSPLKCLLGGVKDTYGDKRLMWYSSRVSSRPEDVKRFVETARACYNCHQFEYPLEMLFVTPSDIIAIQKINWDKDNSDEERRAKDLYRALENDLKNAGFFPYRLGVQSQEKASYPEDKDRTLRALKKMFDPNGVVSPGRYGIR